MTEQRPYTIAGTEVLYLDAGLVGGRSPGAMVYARPRPMAGHKTRIAVSSGLFHICKKILADFMSAIGRTLFGGRR